MADRTPEQNRAAAAENAVMMMVKALEAQLDLTKSVADACHDMGSAFVGIAASSRTVEAEGRLLIEASRALLEARDG